MRALWPIVLIACGGSPAGSCKIDETANQGYTTCVNFTGVAYGSQLIMKNCADDLQGSYSAMVCPPGDGGTCVFNGGTQTETQNLYTRNPPSDGGFVDLYILCTTSGGAFVL